MRLLKTIGHPRYRISIFHNQDHFLIQVDDGHVRVAFKVDRTDHDLKKLEQWVLNPECMLPITSALTTMRSCLPKDGTDAYVDEEII